MSKKVFAGIFVSFLGLLFALNVFGEDAYFSEQENRVLAQKPRIHMGQFYIREIYCTV